MTTTVVLLHSPFLDAWSWGEVPNRLVARGLATVTADIRDDDHPPYAAAYVASAAQQIAAAKPEGAVLLVGHSGAGPLLPQVGYAQRAAHRAVAGYVFVDAPLPRYGASRLDLLQDRDSAIAAAVRDRLAAGAAEPAWSPSALVADGLSAALADDVLAHLRARGLAYFEEVLPSPGDWPDAPCAYVQTSEAGAAAARVANLRGFSVLAASGGHFASLVEPDAVADAIGHTLSDAVGG